LEALSSGIPVVAYNSPGPRDVLGDGNPVGLLARDPYELGELAREAWSAVRAGIITSERCRAFGEHFSWRECAERLLEVLPFVSKSEDLAVAATP
jgi:glycosyltransferase involved in cell wall biosynthesis